MILTKASLNLSELRLFAIDWLSILVLVWALKNTYPLEHVMIVKMTPHESVATTLKFWKTILCLSIP